MRMKKIIILFILLIILNLSYVLFIDPKLNNVLLFCSFLSTIYISAKYYFDNFEKDLYIKTFAGTIIIFFTLIPIWIGYYNSQKTKSNIEMIGKNVNQIIGDVKYFKTRVDKVENTVSKLVNIPNNNIDYNILFQKARMLEGKDSKEKEIIELYKKVIELKPDLWEAYYNLGLSYYEMKNNDKVIENFSKVIELNPKYSVAYLTRGIAYAGKSLYDKAIEDFNKAIELNPRMATIYYNRGNAYANKGLNDKAMEDYNKAIELKPGMAIIYHNRAVTYTEMHLYDKAIEDFNKAIELNPNFADAYYKRGILFSVKELFGKCISDWEKAADLGSNKAKVNLKRYFNIDY